MYVLTRHMYMDDMYSYHVLTKHTFVPQLLSSSGTFEHSNRPVSRRQTTLSTWTTRDIPLLITEPTPCSHTQPVESVHSYVSHTLIRGHTHTYVDDVCTDIHTCTTYITVESVHSYVSHTCRVVLTRQTHTYIPCTNNTHLYMMICTATTTNTHLEVLWSVTQAPFSVSFGFIPQLLSN